MNLGVIWSVNECEEEVYVGEDVSRVVSQVDTKDRLFIDSYISGRIQRLSKRMVSGVTVSLRHPLTPFHKGYVGYGGKLGDCVTVYLITL